MASFLEQLSEHATVGNLFEDIHQRAYAVASAIPVLDPSTGSPETGDVYSLLDTWIHPDRSMSVRRTLVRVATGNGAPYLLEVASLHPEDQPDEVLLGGSVQTFDTDSSSSGVGIYHGYKSRLIAVRQEPSINPEEKVGHPKAETRHKPTTEIGKLNSPDRKHLSEVTTGILGTVAATRCLVSVHLAARQLESDDGTEVRLQSARAVVADVFELLGKRV